MLAAILRGACLPSSRLLLPCLSCLRRPSMLFSLALCDFLPHMVLGCAGMRNGVSPLAAMLLLFTELGASSAASSPRSSLYRRCLVACGASLFSTTHSVAGVASIISFLGGGRRTATSIAVSRRWADAAILCLHAVCNACYQALWLVLRRSTSSGASWSSVYSVFPSGILLLIRRCVERDVSPRSLYLSAAPATARLPSLADVPLHGSGAALALLLRRLTARACNDVLRTGGQERRVTSYYLLRLRLACGVPTLFSLSASTGGATLLAMAAWTSYADIL